MKIEIPKGKKHENTRKKRAKKGIFYLNKHQNFNDSN